MARTLLDIVRLTTEYLAARGSDSPRLDAELLTAHALGLRRIDLYLQFDRALSDAEVGGIRELVRRRGGGEPVAYITGMREFYARTFAVNPAVLIPRPETETLVQCAIDEARTRGATVIADLGTGSGCIAITLALELPEVQVVAVDVSEPALEVARANADRHGVSDRIEFVPGSWAAALHSVVDLVVSNPPYVTSVEMGEVMHDVRDYEPRQALDGGPDGLDAYRALIASLPHTLRDGGSLLLEIDPRRVDGVESLLRDAFPTVSTRVVNDLAGSARVVIAHTGA